MKVFLRPWKSDPWVKFCYCEQKVSEFVLSGPWSGSYPDRLRDCLLRSVSNCLQTERLSSPHTQLWTGTSAYRDNCPSNSLPLFVFPRGLSLPGSGTDYRTLECSRKWAKFP